MASITFREVEGSSLKYWLLFGGLGLFVLFGALAWNYMHHHGHVVTGMDNQIVWGLPHVFAVFLIVKAVNRMKRKQVAAPVVTTKQCPECAMAIPIEAKRCGHCTTKL